MNQNILANNMNMYIYSPEFDISKNHSFTIGGGGVTWEEG